MGVTTVSAVAISFKRDRCKALNRSYCSLNKAVLPVYPFKWWEDELFEDDE